MVASPPVEQFRADADAFVAEGVAAGIACPAFGAIMPPALFDRAQAWQRHCFDHGFAGIDWACDHGGRGLAPEHADAWSEACATAGVAAYMNFQGVILAGGAIRTFGTPEQQAIYLRDTLRGDLVWCQLFSEPGSGSDLASLITRAEPTGDGGWRVSGQKVWSSTAQLAHRAILLARTDPGTPGHSGISFFLLDMTAPGIDVRPLKQMTGDTEFCEVFLDDVPVAPDELLGPLHGGWGVTVSVLADERAEVGAAGVGLRRRLHELAPDHPLQRDGRALALLLARSSGAPELGPLTKLALTEFESRRCEAMLAAQGAGGMISSAVGDEFLYAPGMRVAGGTSEIQRNLIGERLLGLPREPRPQR